MSLRPIRAVSQPRPQAKATLTAQYARKLLVYDAETGVLTWRVKASNRVNKGDRAGCMRWDYRAIRVDGGLYLEHRVIWLWSPAPGPRAWSPTSMATATTTAGAICNTS